MRLILILARYDFCLPGIVSIENASLTDPTAIEKQLALGEHVKKGQPLRLLLLSVILPPVTSYHQLELIDTYISMWRHIVTEVLTLISLKKFRHLRRSYYPDDPAR